MSVMRQSFGRTFAPPGVALDAADAVRALLERKVGPGGLLAIGNMRSYGDTCMNSGGSVADMRQMDRIVSFDAESGLMTAEAGVLLSDIIAHVLPHGYFPAVVPGTQFVTLGGAIANDVHGKNHHRRGTFGNHVMSFELLRSDGTVAACDAATNPDLFAATIGGMGLTGMILRATIKLMRVSSADIDEMVTPFASLDSYFEMAEAADAENEYAVAWVDQLAGGRNTGRGVLLTGNHAEGGKTSVASSGSALGVPIQPPVNVLNRPFLKAFNFAYRSAKSMRRHKRSSYNSFFFPLDGVRDWNRLYGPRGLHQHQSVIPDDASRRAIPDMFAAAHRAGQGSFLTVLKRFGDMASPGLMSFPRPGYTLTLDFPNHGAVTMRLLDELDRIAIDAGGAVNPYKDARMSAETFAASFPDWRALEAERDPAFMSDFWQRTAVELDSEPMRYAAE